MCEKMIIFAVMKKICTFILICMALIMTGAVQTAWAQKKAPHTYLWSAKPPHSSADKKDSAYVEVYLPKPEMATGRAVIVCPGGAYVYIAMKQEGRDWAPFFNNEGIACIVLHYRKPYGDRRIPLEDIERCMVMVKERAKEWHINPTDIGVMGLSAGGHLASTFATHATSSLRPAFQILCYPVITMDPAGTHKGTYDAFFGGKAKKKDVALYSNDLQVSSTTPRAWVALSHDDTVVLPANGINYCRQLMAHKVPVCLHTYPSGGHGWGFKQSFEYHVEMQLELRSWLRSF